MDTFKLMLQRFALLAVLLLALWFCWTFRDELGRTFQPDPLALLLIVLALALGLALPALKFGLMLWRRGYRLRTGTLFFVSCRCDWLAYFRIQKHDAPEAKPGIYRQYFRIPPPLSRGVLAYLKLATVFTCAAMGILAGVWVLVDTGQVTPPLYWLVFSSSMLFCVSIVMGVYKLGGITRLPRYLQVWVANLFAVFSGTHIREVLGMLALTVLGLVVQSSGWHLLFQSFGITLPPVYLLFIAIFTTLVAAVPLLPENLGLREAAIVLLLAHMDLPLVPLLGALILARLLQFGLLTGLGIAGRRQLPASRASGASAALGEGERSPSLP